MKLLPPPEKIYTTLDQLIKSINKWAGPQGYAVVKRRSKFDKKNSTLLIAAYYICDQGREPPKKRKIPTKRQGVISRANECPFSCVGRRTKDGDWKLTVRKDEHNHEPT